MLYPQRRLQNAISTNVSESRHPRDTSKSFLPNKAFLIPLVARWNHFVMVEPLTRVPSHVLLCLMPRWPDKIAEAVTFDVAFALNFKVGRSLRPLTELERRRGCQEHRRSFAAIKLGDRAGRAGMNRFAELLDRLAYEHGRNNKLRLMTDYFRSTPDPERGWALAALTGALNFTHAKPGLIRSLIAERTDPVLFALSYDYVGDLSETVALMWPAASSPADGEGKGVIPHRRHRDARHARQGATAAAARGLARCARCDRPLGADQARHRRLARRRLGAAGESRGRRHGRQGGAGDRADLARADAAL